LQAGEGYKLSTLDLYPFIGFFLFFLFFGSFQQFFKFARSVDRNHPFSLSDCSSEGERVLKTGTSTLI
jgi:hypothetical protein